MRLRQLLNDGASRQRLLRSLRHGLIARSQRTLSEVVVLLLLSALIPLVPPLTAMLSTAHPRTSTATALPESPRMTAATGVAGLKQSLKVIGIPAGNPKITYGYATQNTVTLSTWTIEFWVWGVGTNCTTGETSAFGILNTNSSNQIESTALAGLEINGGIGSFGTFFEWPGGSYQLPPAPNGDCVDNSSAVASSTPTAIAEDYDGTTVRGYINGSLYFSQAASLSPIVGPAGIADTDSWSTANMDEFRVSSTAVYTGSTYALQTAEFTNGQSGTLVQWHMDDYGIGRVNEAYLCTYSNPANFSFPSFLQDSSQTGGNGASLDYWALTGSLQPWCADNLTLSQGQSQAASELGGPDEYCPWCALDKGHSINSATGEMRETYSDVSIAGRGYGLSFNRTYSSLEAGQDGPLGFGWTDNFNSYLTFDGNGNPTVHEQNGTTTPFSLTSGSGCTSTYTPPGRVLASLAVDASCAHYVLTRGDGTQLQFSYPSPYPLTQITDRNGYADTLAYSGSLLTTVTDQAGRQLSFTYYSGTDHIQTITDPAGRTVTYGYSGGAAGTGDLVSVQDVAGNTSTYQYGQTGNHTGVTPPAHYLTTYQDAKCHATTGCAGIVTEYDGSNRGTYQTDALGRVTQVLYDRQCVTNSTCDYTKTIDPAGNVEMQEFENNLLLRDITGYGTPQQATTSYQYDPITLEPIATTDPNGNVWRSTFDEGDTITRGTLLSSTDPLNRTITYGGYNSFGEPSSMVKPAPTNDSSTITTNYTYDGNGNLTQEIDAAGSNVQSTTSYCYNYSTSSPCYTSSSPVEAGDMVQMADSAGKLWKQTYDQYGNPASSTDPLGNKTQYFYDSVGRPICTISPLGSAETSCSAPTPNYVTSYSNDAYGDVTQVTDPLGDLTGYQFDQNRNQTQVTDANGSRTINTYDLDNELIEVDNGCNTATPPVCQHKPYQSTEYDAAGRVFRQYDGFSRLVYDAAISSGSTTLTSSTASFGSGDVNGTVIVNGAGASGADLSTTISSVTNATTAVLATSASTSVSNSTTSIGRKPSSYLYDPLSRLTSMSDPLGRVSTYGYDAAGNQTSVAYGSNPTTTYCYDAANELSGYQLTGTCPSSPSASNMSVYYTYYKDGQRSTMSDATGTSSYTFDSLDRLTKEVNGASQEVDYGYDAAGRLNKLTYPGGTNVVNRTYYDNGELKTVQSWADTQPNTFYYDADANLCLTTFANGTVGTRTYDRADRLASSGTPSMVYASGGATACGQTPTGTTLLSLTYARDAVGQVTNENCSAATTAAAACPSGGSTSYGYDAFERLQSAGSNSYGMDAADQLTSLPLPGGNNAAQNFDAAGQLTSASVGGGPITYTFDTAGNRLSSSGPNGLTRSYTYDQLNRLSGFAGTRANTWFPARSFTYAYNGDGLRMSKNIDGVQSTTYAWDAAEGLPELLQDGSTSYVTGPGGLPLEQIAGGKASYYQADQLGSTRVVTDSSGNPEDTYSYDPYGNIATSSLTVVNPFTFAGQYQDPESGLLYLSARYYDPSTGQFLSRDPIAGVTRQPYSYTADNPLNARDPSGLDYSFTNGGHINDEGEGFGSWSQAVQDLYLRASGQIQGLQVRQRGFVEDPEHLFNDQPGQWVEHYNMFCQAKAALQDTLDRLLQLAGARSPAAGAQEAYNELQGPAQDVMSYDPAAGGLPSGYRWGGVDDSEIVPDLPIIGGGEDDFFPLDI